MNQKKALAVLRAWDNQGKYIFTSHELTKLFPNDKPATFKAGLHRLLANNFLQRAYRGVYVNPYAASRDSYTIEHIAKALRPGDYTYVSLESALSEYGVISQIPMDRVTLMTTGRSGLYKTSFGVIEYTHTKRSWVEIMNNVYCVPKRPLRIASKEIAWRDLKRVGRNLDLVNLQVLHDKE